MPETDPVERERRGAMVDTARYLAHDLRRPLSLMKLGLEMLADSHDPQQMQRRIARLLPEVRRALHASSRALANVMELEDRPPPATVPTAPEALLETVQRTD